MVPLHLVLHLDILSDDFIRYVTTTCDKVAASPKVSPPELPCQFLVFPQQLAGGLSLEPLDEFRYREMVGGTDKKRCRWSLETWPLMISTSIALQISLTRLPHPDRYSPMKNGLAVFSDPYHMEFDVIDSMRSLAVVFHNTASLLKSSPKGEGFSPFPDGDIKGDAIVGYHCRVGKDFSLLPASRA